VSPANPRSQTLRKLRDAFLRLRVVQFVDSPEERESINGGQVIPQLRTLPEDRANVIGKFPTLFPECVPEHLSLTVTGEQDAGQHLDGGGLASPVRTDKTEQIPRFHLEREPAYRFDGGIFRPDERAHGTA
jgi:hypothetical protein